MFALPRANRAQHGWQKRALRSILVIRSERNRADLPLLTVARERGVFVRSADDANHNAIPEDLSYYKFAKAGDLVINKMKAWQGSLGIAPVDGIVSPAYFVFKADFAVPQFGEYLLRSSRYVAEFGAASDGVRIGQWDLNIPRMRNIEVYLPSEAEQAAIVKYLAHASARIDKAIAAKRRLILLLEEQQVTNARREIDRIPAPRVPLKRALQSITAGIWGADPEESDEEPRWCVRVADFDYGRSRVNSNVITLRSIADRDFSKKHLKHGDLLLEGSGGGDKTSVGRVVVFNHSRPAVCSNFLQRLRPAMGVDSLYLALVLRDIHASGAARLHVKQTTGIQNLDLGTYLAMDVPLPSKSAQKGLVSLLQKSFIESDAVIGRVEREVSLLQEFRTRLVADVVTGQVDIRAIAATLPDAPEPLDNLTVESDDDLEDVLSQGEE